MKYKYAISRNLHVSFVQIGEYKPANIYIYIYIGNCLFIRIQEIRMPFAQRPYTKKILT